VGSDAEGRDIARVPFQDPVCVRAKIASTSPAGGRAMTPTLQQCIDTALARGTVYQCLAQAYTFPGEAVAAALTGGFWLTSLQEAMDVLQASDACRHALEALELLQPTLDVAGLRQEYARLFSNAARGELSPYGADYLVTPLHMKAQRLADVAGYYHACGIEVAAGTGRPDHIAAELEFMGYLCFKEAYAAENGLPEAFEVATAAQQRFFAEHLGRWAPLFLQRFETASAQPFYRALASLAQAFLADEAARLGVSPEPVAPPTPDIPGAAGEGDGPLRWRG
jgi:DMSO reductase family type II enzyme chaperone